MCHIINHVQPGISLLEKHSVKEMFNFYELTTKWNWFPGRFIQQLLVSISEYEDTVIITCLWQASIQLDDDIDYAISWLKHLQLELFHVQYLTILSAYRFPNWFSSAAYQWNAFTRAQSYWAAEWIGLISPFSLLWTGSLWNDWKSVPLCLQNTLHLVHIFSSITKTYFYLPFLKHFIPGHKQEKNGR